MTARVVIDQIKALPAEELAEVVQFVRGLQVGAVESPSNVEFTDAAAKVFNDHAELMRRLSQ